ncbi:amino acid transporter [Methylobacterium sp. BE186]|uniref:APC family permease n=1 Tax=Methylobacterium sp. BE186 TaxID=2817715 RepID=UPI002861BD0F|nr:APC family permease [Methylobacterium sp. BE186]MDR7038904.1 amino acid transporter [Methylobacterium sp. BE186]
MMPPRRPLTAFEAFVLSLAIIAPTLAMAFNVPLAAQAAGRAAPLAFLIGGGAMALIGLSFVAFSRRIATAGSAFAYVEAVFGRRLGFLAGWGLLLAYGAFLASATGLVGGFLAVALEHLGLGLPGLWQGIAAAGGLLVIHLGGREIRSITALMLAIEAAALLAILVLAGIILARTPLSAAPFLPDPGRGWSGIGFGMVFAVLSLAGFEGAATLAEETRDPHRSIPLAIVGSLAAATLLYTLVSYAQVAGYGPDGVQALAAAHAPLDTLASRFISDRYAICLDLAAGVSSLACALGTAAAAARILATLGRNGLGARLAAIDPVHGAPRRALRIVGAGNLLALALFGSLAGSRAYSEAFATVATLVLILVYMAVAAAQMVQAVREGRRAMALVGGLGAALLAWPLLNSLYPLPDGPGLLWPLVVIAWMGGGVLLGRAGRLGGPQT